MGKRKHELSYALREELTCSICLNTFTNPLMLRCQHTFCANCIAPEQIPSVKNCPLCQETFDTTDPDFKMSRLVDVYNDHVKQKRHSREKRHADINYGTCELCDINETEHMCYSCSKQLCHICLKSHLKLVSCEPEKSAKIKNLAVALEKTIEMETANLGHIMQFCEGYQLMREKQIKIDNTDEALHHIGKARAEALEYFEQQEDQVMAKLKEQLEKVKQEGQVMFAQLNEVEAKIHQSKDVDLPTRLRNLAQTSIAIGQQKIMAQDAVTLSSISLRFNPYSVHAGNNGQQLVEILDEECISLGTLLKKTGFTLYVKPPGVAGVALAPDPK